MGQIVGFYVDSSNVYYTTIDDPMGTHGSVATGINDLGEIVGYYLDSSGAVQIGGEYTDLQSGTPHGFLAVASTSPTVAVSIDSTDINIANPTGQVTFVFSEAPTTFALADTSAIGGTLSNLHQTDATHYTATFTASPNTDISNASVSVTAGSYQDPAGNAGAGGSTAAFTVDTVSGYTYTTLNDPSGANGTVAFGINNSGEIVGYYVDSNGVMHGYLYSNGTYTAVTDPSALIDASVGGYGTYAHSINGSGQIVGIYADAGGIHGFLYSGGTNGTYTTLDDPSTTPGTAAVGISIIAGTAAAGINDLGQIVGYYHDLGGARGFLATPALPPATPAAPADSAVVNSYVNAANDTAAQTLSGTAEDGSTVTIYDNGTQVGSTTANAATGAWSLPIGQLADGSSHSYTVTATDTAGNVSQPSDALGFVVDTTAPTVAVSIDNTDINIANPTAPVTFTFSEAPTDFSLNDVTSTDGTLSNLSGSGTTYTATFTAHPGVEDNAATRERDQRQLPRRCW